MKIIFFLVLTVWQFAATAQVLFKGRVLNAQTGEPLAGATVLVKDSGTGTVCDNEGNFQFKTIPLVLQVSALGFETAELKTDNKNEVTIYLSPTQKELDAVVVSGTLRPVKKLESPVAVEVYTAQFLKKNPAPSIFESLQNINGVRPQFNCNVCNTGDIHINGLEGPYTMITIDGMPIVSSLASVYGLFGIPSQLIDRVEIVKGPASGLYGAEAIGGLINIITKSPDKVPSFTANFMTTSWLEHNLDAGARLSLGKKASSLLGINYFNFQQPFDKNKDGFTDIALQQRISVFNKVKFYRKQNRIASLAGRFFYENRWGGETRWNKSFRGGDSIYGESIDTKRWEIIGNYQLPVKDKMFFSFSATEHIQDSYYGIIPYWGKQTIGFAQLIWDKPIGATHQLLSGIAARYNYYDDNSTATTDTLNGESKPEKYSIPGLFIQDEWRINEKHLLLLGMRYDHHPVHKNILTPRIAWKWALTGKQVFRLNAGTGFRVVSLFTEEHAALTGARAVEIQESLNPERSYNINLNYTFSQQWRKNFINVDLSVWYSHFTNQIIADYDTDPNKIIYNNLSGFAASKGFTLNAELQYGKRFKTLMGVTLQDVYRSDTKADGSRLKLQPVLTERWSGTWAISYTIPKAGITIDYTGNIYGPMRLPLVSTLDPRPPASPVWSIQNVQISMQTNMKLELFAGVKNLLNWTPAKSAPFIIARPHDPFDKQVTFDAAGKALATSENPFALTFDPSYVYAPNQGIRFFIGARFSVKK